MSSSEVSFFNSKEAILLAAMCYQTYVQFERGGYVLPKGYKQIYTIRAAAGSVQQNEEVFGYIAESTDRIIVVFRGSVSAEDIDSDQDVFQVPFPYVKNSGKTQRGVTCIYQSMRNSIINVVKKLSAKKKLLITGHSLGGAIAVLFAFDVSRNTKFNNPYLYTIASFRVGDPEFISKFNKTVKYSIRIANVHDSIPVHFVGSLYPPPFTKDGLYYRHVNNMFPLSFQLNNMTLNHNISCYFKNLSEFNLIYAKQLNGKNPGLCPDTEICRLFKENCGKEK